MNDKERRVIDAAERVVQAKENHLSPAWEELLTALNALGRARYVCQYLGCRLGFTDYEEYRVHEHRPAEAEMRTAK